jgi:hypothetical protein
MIVATRKSNKRQMTSSYVMRAECAMSAREERHLTHPRASRVL